MGKYLTIGGGTFCERQDGWLNLDYKFEATMHKRKKYWDRIDIEHNLMSEGPLPIDDNTFDGVYTEHCMEHLPKIKTLHIFKEVYRILVPGGIFRVAVPDADKIWEALAIPGSPTLNENWPHKGNDGTEEYLFLDALSTPLKGFVKDEYVRTMINELPKEQLFDALEINVTPRIQASQPGYHYSCWNFERLYNALNEIGFKNISGPCDQNESSCEAFRKHYIDASVPNLSVRIEAIK